MLRKRLDAIMPKVAAPDAVTIRIRIVGQQRTNGSKSVNIVEISNPCGWLVNNVERNGSGRTGILRIAQLINLAVAAYI